MRRQNLLCYKSATLLKNALSFFGQSWRQCSIEKLFNFAKVSYFWGWFFMSKKSRKLKFMTLYRVCNKKLINSKVRQRWILTLKCTFMDRNCRWEKVKYIFPILDTNLWHRAKLLIPATAKYEGAIHKCADGRSVNIGVHTFRTHSLRGQTKCAEIRVRLRAAIYF